jgi:hypothetical protein
MTAIRLCTAAILLLSLAGCKPNGNEDWRMVGDAGVAGEFVDAKSVKRVGRIATFESKYASTRWIKIGRDTGEIRKTMQIDCTANTFRVLGGGIYVHDERRWPLAELRSGQIPPSGYMRETARLVC